MTFGNKIKSVTDKYSSPYTLGLCCCRVDIKRHMKKEELPLAKQEHQWEHPDSQANLNCQSPWKKEG